ncbi:MAG: efflux RND transporter permease subunit [Candidatus Krumholzibacteriia bacterium]
MRSFFRYFASRHLLATLITLMTILLGLHSLSRIKRDVFPTVDFGELIVTTVYPGASPEDVELNVTNKIEKELKEVSGIDRMTSVSMENISVLDVVIDPNLDDQDDVKREIRDAVNRITDFPEAVDEAPEIAEISTAVFPVVEVGLSGDIPYRELREHAKRFEQQLEDLPGVSSVDRYGYRDREIQVEVSPEAMDRYQIPLREIMNAIAGRNIRATGGTFESYTDEKTVVTLAQFRNPMEVGNVIVRSTFDGPLIRIRDLAIVEDDFEDERIISRMNGRPSISFIVNKKESADVIRTVDAIKGLVERMNGSLPEGVEVLYSADQSFYVRNRIKVVTNNGWIGLGMVLLMLSLFLNMRSAFWVAMGIPVTVLGVVFMLPLFDSYLDVIALAAMIQVIGIIVDDGIIIAENVHMHRERGEPPLQAAVEGISEVFWPVLTTIVTTFMAFAPMFFMSGIMGKFVVVIPLVMSLALFISLFEAMTALPAHLIMGLREGGVSVVRKTRSWFDRVRALYEKSMRHVLTLRYLVVFVSVVSLAACLWYAVNFMDFVLFPTSSADTFYLLIELPTGSSLQATSKKVEKLEELIVALPDEEVQSFVTRVGTQGEFSPGENENWAIIGVNLTPYDKRSRVADEIVEDLRVQSARIEGFEKVVYLIDAGGPPVGRPITIRVVGNGDAERKALADSVVAFLAGFDGVKDIDRNDKRGKDQVEIKIDYGRLARVGLSVADIAQSVRFAYDGEVVTDVRYGDEDVDFRVQLDERARRNPRFLKELLVPNSRGRMIPLSDVARLATGPGPSNYYHFDGDRAVTITADVVNGVTTPVKATNAVVERFDVEQDWPNLRFEIGGEAEETQESMRSLFQAFLIAVVGIYFVLMLLFNSPTQPGMVMIAIPFGIMGVIVAFALHGQDIGFLAMMGLVGLSGIVVNDSLVLVNHINDIKRDSKGATVKEMVIQGATDRLRPVLLTTVTTVVGLLPLAYGIGGSDPFMAPMALALGYGILFASPLTLGIVPSLYVISDDVRRLFRRRRKDGAG